MSTSYVSLQCDGYFGFSIGDQQYFTFLTDFDGGVCLAKPTSCARVGIFIYPSCNESNPIQSIIDGNPSGLILGSSNARDSLTGGNEENFYLLTTTPNHDNFPIRFELTNNDISNTFTFKFTSPTFDGVNALQCTYSAVSTEKDFKLYFTLDAENEVMLIESFTVNGTNIGFTPAPTSLPTQIPSTYPSSEPTTCIDYGGYNSMDDTFIRNPNIPEISDNYTSSNGIIDVYSLSMETGLPDIITCNKTNAGVCIVKCNEKNICIQTQVELASSDQSYSNLSELIVSCTKKRACKDLAINIDKININTVNIICDNPYSCQQSNITIKAISDIDLTLDCISSDSCQDLKIFLEHGDHEMMNIIKANISCYDDSSCDSLELKTDDTENIFITINIYHYSRNIKINHQYWKDINLTCNDDTDQKFIKYDTNDVPDTTELLDIARREYGTFLPCEGVFVECSGNDPDLPKQDCQFEYSVIDGVILDLLNHSSDGSCYWIDIAQILEVNCEGTCGDTQIYNLSDQSFELNLNITAKSDHRYNETENITLCITKTCSVCTEYFGTPDAMQSSLNVIDSIFNNVLNILSGGSIIHDIINPPVTSLQGNETFVKCNNDSNTLKISTNVTIEILETDIDDVKNFFLPNSQFVNDSRDLLENIFGIIIAIIPDPVKQPEPESITNTKVYIWTGSLTSILCCCIICYCGYKKERLRAKIFMKTIYVKNPMVIPIAIGLYEDEPVEPEINGYLIDLDEGVRRDIDNIKTLFGDQLKYDIFPNYEDDDINSYKVTWKRNELMQFLTEKSNDLEDNLTNQDINNKPYDGLLVFVSCHGMDQHIITSDYKKLSKTELHRIFSKFGSVREIPRLFIYDCCSGNKERDTETRYRLAMGDSDDESSSDEDQDEERETLTNGDGIAGGQINKDDINTNSTDERKNDEKEYGKAINKTKIEVEIGNIERVTSVVWARDENNPDYQLAVINAANEGFQAKLDTVSGSYVITEFTQKVRENINDKHNERFLFEIFEEIQSDLHDQGKQLPENTFNNGTRYIKFDKNYNKKDNDGISNDMNFSRTDNQILSAATEMEIKSLDLDEMNTGIELATITKKGDYHD